MNDNFYRISIKALVLDDEGRFLLAKEDVGKWELLGGGMKHGESPQDALKREVKEETGIDVVWVDENPSYFLTVENTHQGFWQANVIYKAKLASLDFTPSPECQELKFFSVEEAKKEKFFPNVEIFLSLFEKGQ